MRFLLFVLMTLLAAPAHSHAMRQAAESLLGALPDAARAKVMRPFDDRDLLRQHYAMAPHAPSSAARGSSHRH